MPDQTMPQPGEVRTANGETRKWSGTRWEAPQPGGGEVSSTPGSPTMYHPGLGDTPESARNEELMRTAKEAGIGLLRSPYDLVKGMFNTVAHPIDAVSGMAHTVAHPLDTIKAIGDDPRAGGSMLGQLLLAPKVPAITDAAPGVIGRGISAVGRGAEAVGGSVPARTAGALAGLGSALHGNLTGMAEALIPPALEYGGKGLQATGDAIASVKPNLTSAVDSAMTGLKNVGTKAFNAADNYMTAEPPYTGASGAGNPDLVRGVVDYAGDRASQINAKGVPYKDAMGKASQEAGWPLGESKATNIKYPSDYPDHSVDDVLQTLHDYPEAFDPRQQPVMPPTPKPVLGATHLDEMLRGERTLDFGRLPETQRMPAATHPYGPNTVGAAEAQPTIGSSYMPRSVDEGEGLTLPEQDAWSQHKAANPNANLDEWYRSIGGGADPNAGKTVPGAVDDLMSLLGKRPQP